MQEFKQETLNWRLLNKATCWKWLTIRQSIRIFAIYRGARKIDVTWKLESKSGGYPSIRIRAAHKISLQNNWLCIKNSPTRVRASDLRINSPPLSSLCLQREEESKVVFLPGTKPTHANRTRAEPEAPIMARLLPPLSWKTRLTAVPSELIPSISPEIEQWRARVGKTGRNDPKLPRVSAEKTG